MRRALDLGQFGHVLDVDVTQFQVGQVRPMLDNRRQQRAGGHAPPLEGTRVVCAAADKRGRGEEEKVVAGENQSKTILGADISTRKCNQTLDGSSANAMGATVLPAGISPQWTPKEKMRLTRLQVRVVSDLEAPDRGLFCSVPSGVRMSIMLQ